MTSINAAVLYIGLFCLLMLVLKGNVGRVRTREKIGFGDGGNDTDMLAYAGIGVAMGNATAEPKAAADYITDDVDHDGVRNALLHFRVLRD